MGFKMFASLGRKAFGSIFQRKSTYFAFVVTSAFIAELVAEKLTDGLWESSNLKKLMHHNKMDYGKWEEEEP